MTRDRFALRRIHIESFRGIDRLTLDLTEPHRLERPLSSVMLAGDNGCGKTSILEAIILGLGRPDLLSPDAARLEDEARFGSPSFSIELALELGGKAITLRATPKILSQREWSPGSPGHDFWSHIAELKPELEYFSARRTHEVLRSIYAASGGATGALGPITGALGPSGASGPTGPRTFSRQIFEDVSDGYVPAPSRRQIEARRVNDLKQRLKSVYVRQLMSKQPLAEGSPWARIQAFWSKFDSEDGVLDVLPVDNNPGSGEDVVLRYGDALPAHLTSIAMARAAAASGARVARIVPIDRLSSGQVALFAFVGPLVFRDEPPDLVLIDEPEQHMHAQWQRVLLGSLQALCPESQLFVATHSTEILESALSYERFILAREADPRPSKDEVLATA